MRPTFRPQAVIRLHQLWARLCTARIAPPAVLEEGRAIRLGNARLLFLSAEPGANVVGHTAGLLLEVDEAQDIDPDHFDRAFRPMAAAGATIVFYGTAWRSSTLLERAKQHHLEQERGDGVQRHFQYDWRTVAAHTRPTPATWRASGSGWGRIIPCSAASTCSRRWTARAVRSRRTCFA